MSVLFTFSGYFELIIPCSAIARLFEYKILNLNVANDVINCYYVDRELMHAMRDVRVALKMAMSVVTNNSMVGMEPFRGRFRGRNIICNTVAQFKLSSG